MVDKHIVRGFDNDLEGIRNHINSISGLVETQLSYCYKSLSERDADLAERVIKRDKQIDNLYQELMDLSIRLFALRQPFANDLRYVFSSLKIASDLERIGDSTKNIAKAARWLAKLPQTQNILSIDNLFDLVLGHTPEFDEPFGVPQFVPVRRKHDSVASKNLSAALDLAVSSLRNWQG